MQVIFWSHNYLTLCIWVNSLENLARIRKNDEKSVLKRVDSNYIKNIFTPFKHGKNRPTDNKVFGADPPIDTYYSEGALSEPLHRPRITQNYVGF